MFVILRRERLRLVLLMGILVILLGLIISGQLGLFFYGKIAPVLAHGKPLIIIDAGHGGRDPGAVVGGVNEKNINLIIAKEVERLLKNKGYRVSMTRAKDTNLVNWKDNGSYQRASLWQRAHLSKKKNAQVLVSIHCNSDSNKAFFGPQTFYHPQSTKGRELAQTIQAELIKVKPSKRRAIPGNYYLLNNTSCTTVIVELGYLSNEKDRSSLCSTEYRKKFAQAIATGISKNIIK